VREFRRDVIVSFENSAIELNLLGPGLRSASAIELAEKLSVALPASSI